MNRRHLLALVLAAAARPAHAATPSVAASLIDGGWDGDVRIAGLKLELEEGWKTYWRMPGEAGVPPEFDWSATKNLQRIEVLYPLPERLVDGSGESVGYKHQVVFPLRIAPADPAKPIALSLALFIGVCKDVCVPLHVKADAVLQGDGPPSAELAAWLQRVPKPAPDASPVSEVTLVIDSGKPALMLSLAAPVDDIFVETDGSAYFRRPDFAADGRSARIAIDNVKEGEALRGKTLKLTVSQGGQGLEQQFTLA